MTKSSKEKHYFSPLRLLAVTLGALFLAEAVIMLLLQYLPPFSHIQEALIDAVLLALVLFPVLYFLLFRPIRFHINQKERFENALQQANLALEERVRRRTAELEEANTFIELYFPLSRSAAPMEAAPASLEAYAGRERILVVEDMAEQRELAEIMLNRMGYTVDTAGNGEEAVRFLEEQQVDLVLLDMIMEGMDGLDTFKAIRAIRPWQKVVIVSGFAETRRVQEALRLGAGIYLKKPFSMESLGLCIRRELERQETRADG